MPTLGHIGRKPQASHGCTSNCHPKVRSLSNSVAVLLTCGGIGPTLDDVTMEGVAQGLGTVLSR